MSTLPDLQRTLRIAAARYHAARGQLAAHIALHTTDAHERDACLAQARAALQRARAAIDGDTTPTEDTIMCELTLSAAGIAAPATVTEPGEFAIRCHIRWRAARLGASDALREHATRDALRAWRSGASSGTRAITDAHGWMRQQLAGETLRAPDAS